MSDPTIFTLQILSYAILFGMGFIIGRITGSVPRLEPPRILPNYQLRNTQVFENMDEYIKDRTEVPTIIPPAQRESLKTQFKPKKAISIDESRVVTKVATEELVRNGELGVKVESEDSVGSSVSKLALLKKNK